MQTRLSASVGAVAVVMLAACAPAASGEQGERPMPERAVVRVENNHYNDVNVYLLRNGARWRLGTVTGMTSATFAIPPRVAANAGNVRLLADPIGGTQTFTSELVRLESGARLQLNLNSSLQTSNVAVAWQ